MILFDEIKQVESVEAVIIPKPPQVFQASITTQSSRHFLHQQLIKEDRLQIRQIIHNQLCGGWRNGWAQGQRSEVSWRSCGVYLLRPRQATAWHRPTETRASGDREGQDGARLSFCLAADESEHYSEPFCPNKHQIADKQTRMFTCRQKRQRAVHDPKNRIRPTLLM